ncbi:MAG: FAD-dependent oxidoreductase [Candidatus Omnitrophica bacterium]|nr:FAD-dependent oxidoreductase [Candidatus Omnitrophota bacterium]
MKKVIIIGGGFAGLSALAVFCRSKRQDLEVTLINEKDKVSFLPMLPDCLGRNINPEHLIFDLAEFSAKKHSNFIMDKVAAVNLEKRELVISNKNLKYDFLIISSGSETNFYGNNEIRHHSFKLDDAQDAGLIRKSLDENKYDSFLVTGAGYTGIEVATNLRVYLEKRKINKRIIIVERAASILGPLPQWTKDYVADNLKRLNIEVLLNSSIDKAEGGKISLSGGVSFDNSMLIWAAGVKTSDFIQNLNVEKNPQGRIRVDEYLRVNNTCFAAGDAAYFSYKNNFLRMAVQFAIIQGDCCAKNIIKNIEGRKLIKFRPIDLGLIIPMANNKAAGRVLGIEMKGFLPIFFHYVMCIYRSYGLKNKFGIIKDLMGINA